MILTIANRCQQNNKQKRTKMKRNVLLIGAIVLSIGSMSFSLFKQDSHEEIAYFDYNKAYNECDMKVTLEKDLEKLVSLRKSELDSLQLELSLMSNSIKSGNSQATQMDSFQELKQRYLMLSGKYEEENMRLKEEYFSQIRSHINKKAKEYGESNGYDYLFAATGDGSLMYAEQTKEVTSDFLKFLNK